MTEKEVFEGIPEYHNEDESSGRWRVVNEEGYWRHIDGCNLSRFKGKRVRVTIEEVPEAAPPNVPNEYQTCKHYERPISGSNCSPCLEGRELHYWEPKVSEEPKDSEGVPVTYKDGDLIMGDHKVAIDKIAEAVLGPQDGAPEPGGMKCKICESVLIWSAKFRGYVCPDDPAQWMRVYRPGEKGGSP